MDYMSAMCVRAVTTRTPYAFALACLWSPIGALAADSNERLGGGFGGFVVLGVVVAVALAALYGVAAVGEGLNKMVGRNPDDEYGSKVLLIGGLISGTCGLMFAMLDDRRNFAENFLVWTIGIWVFLGWLWNRG